MLKELNIRNFAIIEQLRVEFAPGLNVFTGETGAGKSIVVDAVSLALGERASSDLIRTGCEEAVVEAAFELNGRGTEAANEVLTSQGIHFEPGEDLIVRRVLSASGKNKVYINGSLANLATLNALGSVLADIHGQHEHQSLLSPEHQLDLLDIFGNCMPMREDLATDFRRLLEVRKKLAAAEAGERDRAQREEMLRFQKEEIEQADLLPGEDEKLAQEQQIAANSEKLAAVSAMVEEVLHASDDSVLVNVKKAMSGLRGITTIDNRLEEVMELCETGRANLEEAARQIGSYRESVEFDPQHLERIGDRLDLIQKLKKKYGGSIEDVLAFGEKAAADLAAMERADEIIGQYKSEIQDIKLGLSDLAAKLTKKRTSAAKELQKKVESELGHLGMKKAKFSLKITQEEGGDTMSALKLTARGADTIEFMIAPNPGEDPKPLSRIASGGELSRIMLALKTILVEGDGIPTVVFDEVDAGIGGVVAEEVGKKLKRVAAKRQVFCITHLAQIASMAGSHYGVSKAVKNERTTTEVKLLDQEDRVEEIARMLGGASMTEATLKHAREMIERGTS